MVDPKYKNLLFVEIEFPTASADSANAHSNI